MVFATQLAVSRSACALYRTLSAYLPGKSIFIRLATSERFGSIQLGSRSSLVRVSSIRRQDIQLRRQTDDKFYTLALPFFSSSSFLAFSRASTSQSTFPRAACRIVSPILLSRGSLSLRLTATILARSISPSVIALSYTH